MKNPRFLRYLPLLVLGLHSPAALAQTAPPAPPVAIAVDLAKPTGPLQPLWAYFGYDEPNYTYMKDGQQLLTELASTLR